LESWSAADNTVSKKKGYPWSTSQRSRVFERQSFAATASYHWSAESGRRGLQLQGFKPSRNHSQVNHNKGLATTYLVPGNFAAFYFGGIGLVRELLFDHTASIQKYFSKKKLGDSAKRILILRLAKHIKDNLCPN